MSKWMRTEDETLCIGSLCVLADSSFGNPIVIGRPDEYWPVTTDLSLDVGEHLARGDVLSSESWTAHRDATGGLAQGRILDKTGQTIAVGTNRMRYVPIPTSFEHHDRTESANHEKPKHVWASTADALGARIEHDGTTSTLFLPSNPGLMNPMGMIHGGALLAAVEIVGRSSLQLMHPRLKTSSLRIAYTRPASRSVNFSAEVQHCGRRFGVARVVGRGETGRSCAVATVTGHSRD